MIRPAARLIRLTSQHSDPEKHGLQTNALRLALRLENHCLVERIELALRATGYTELRDIEASVNARIVRLAGRVPNYNLKQLAQAAAMAIPDVCLVHNDLVVVSPN